MKIIQLLSLSLLTTVLLAGGRTVTDGFESTLVRPSPDRPVEEVCFRLFDVYLPEEFDTNPEQEFPIVYHLTGLGGNNATYSTPDRIVMDRMIENGEAVPMIIVAPDPRVLNYDGSFWVNSDVVDPDEPGESFNNRFEDYIVNELIPFVDEKYRQKKTAKDAAPFRAIMGQSMGGYGSLYFGIKYPELFSAFAGDSPTSFWLIATNLASPPEAGFPDGNSMFSFNKLLMKELKNGVIAPANGDISFGFYSWAGAFSPIVQGIGPANCTFDTNQCLSAAPFCVEYPFVVNAASEPAIVNGSFVANQPILDTWAQFDPFFLLDDADPEVLKRQAIYMDAGADLDLEPVDNVGARFFSDKLNGLDVTNEYVLFNGGHVTCTTITELECYRFTTNLKLFSGKFAEAGIFTPEVITPIVGDMVIDLTGNSVMRIVDKARVGIETDRDEGITQTNVTINISDSARLEIGTADTLGGGLQVGNRFSKSNILNEPLRAEDTITFTLNIDGPDATLQIGKQGYLGFGMGLEGNQTEVANFWGLSSLTNVDSVTLNLQQGRLEHNQIASSLGERGSLLGLGVSKEYDVSLNEDMFVISGGANFATITEANLIHPTVQDVAGAVNPGGIRNQIVETPATEFDKFYGAPKGIYASQTFSENRMTVGILSSSLMLFDTNKNKLASPATQQELFDYLKVDNYFEQGRKRAPINELDGQLIVGYITPRTIMVDGKEQMVMGINRFVVDQTDSCNPLSDPFMAQKVLNEGAVGITLATIDGQEQVIRLYDLDPIVT